MKVCRRCDQPKPLSDFYVRSGYEQDDNRPVSRLSECKVCMIERTKANSPIPPTASRVQIENEVLTELRRQGFIALPGKSCAAPDVDIVVRGGIWVEVKHSSLMDDVSSSPRYVFTMTARQVQRGLLADVVILVCDGQKRTYHLFNADDPVFYMYPNDPSKRRVKSGLQYQPGMIVQRKHHDSRVILTTPRMDAAQNLWSIFDVHQRQIEEELRRGIDRHSNLVDRVNSRIPTEDKS